MPQKCLDWGHPPHPLRKCPNPIRKKCLEKLGFKLDPPPFGPCQIKSRFFLRLASFHRCCYKCSMIFFSPCAWNAAHASLSVCDLGMFLPKKLAEIFTKHNHNLVLLSNCNFLILSFDLSVFLQLVKSNFHACLDNCVCSKNTVKILFWIFSFGFLLCFDSIKCQII